MFEKVYNKQRIILGIIYRHPGSKYDYFSEKLCNQLLKLNEKKTKYVIVGDFNIDLNKYNIASNVTGYLNAIHSVGCNAFIDKPTRITSHGGSCIDHVYSNFLPNQLDNYILQGDISDHYGTLTKISGIAGSREKQITYYRRSNLNERGWNILNSDLKHSISNEVSSQFKYDANNLAQTLTDCYTKVINKHMPLRQSVQLSYEKKVDKPWMTSAIKVSIEKKFQLHDKY